MRVGGSTVDRVSTGRGKIKIRVAKKDGSEVLLLILTNVLYLPNSPSNLISLGLLNNPGIYHHNEDRTLYNQSSKKILAFAKKYKTSFLLHPLNLSSAAVKLLREYEVYKGPEVTQTQSNKLHLTLSHQSLDYLNFITLKKHLTYHNIEFINNAEEFICDSCKRAKAKKQYNRNPQPRAIKPFQYIHTNLVGPISPINFGGERYFFTFTNDYTRTTETYIVKQKSK